MILVTTYRVKPYISNDELNELMGVFADVGSAPGTQAHYVSVDGSHGVVITGSDDPAEGYRNLLNYRQWIEFSSSVVLRVEDAVPHIMDSLS